MAEKVKHPPRSENGNHAEAMPQMPFDDALKRILNAPPQPKKAKEQEKAKKK